jgi:hypothetical protein
MVISFYFRNICKKINSKCMFGSMVTKIDFDIINFIKMVLAKIAFKLKWSIFENIYAKVS